MIVSVWVCVAMHVKCTQNNKIAISLQYLKENMKDEVDFLPPDKHQRFLQIDTIIFSVCGQACPNYSKKQIWCFFAIKKEVKEVRNEVSDEVDFLHPDKHEIFLQIDTKNFDGDSQAFPKFPK